MGRDVSPPEASAPGRHAAEPARCRSPNAARPYPGIRSAPTLASHDRSAPFKRRSARRLFDLRCPVVRALSHHGQGPARAGGIPAAFSFMALSTLGGMVFAGIGGFVASAIAGRRPIAHALATALLLALGATASLVQTLDQRGAVWSQVAALALIAPCAIVGGWLSSRRHTT